MTTLPPESQGAAERLVGDTVKALALVIDFDEGRKLHHGWRVAVLAHEIGQPLGLAADGRMFLAGLLHDIGAVGLRDHVVHQASGGAFDAEAQRHGLRGAHILAPLRALEPIVPFIEHHHEQHDGGGFPRGLRGREIPLGAAVIGLADGLEIALRDIPPEARAAAAAAFTRGASAGRVAPEVAAAALEVLRPSGELLAALYDDVELERRVSELEPRFSGAARVDRLALLGQLLWVFARVVDAKHAFTMGHSTRVGFYAYKIAQDLGAEDVNVWDVVWAALLHDVGKVGVPRELLEKAPALAAEDWPVVRRHAADSRDIIATIRDLAYLAEPASSHHERYDGQGYPRGASGEAIPLVGRILAYADVYEALTHDRPHRRGLPHADALAVMRSEVGSRLDPHLAAVAFAALERHGLRAGRSSRELQAFEGFFVSDTADLTRLFGDPAQAPQSVRALGRGGVLMPAAEPWTSVRLGPALEILEGAQALGEVLGDTAPRNALELVDAPSRDALRRLGRTARAGSLATEHLFTPAGRPLEVLLTRDEAGLLLHLRPADARLQSMQRTALFYRNFLASHEAVLFTDPNGVILDANRRFCSLFGYELREVIGRSPRMLSSGRQPADFYQQLWSCLKDPSVGFWSGELVDRHKNGEELDVLLSIDSVRDSAGTCIGFIGRLLDRTEQKRLERRVAEMAAFAEHAPAPLLRLDAALGIELANEAMRGLFGATALSGRPWPSLCAELDVAACLLAIAADGAFQHEARLGGLDFLLTYQQVEGGAIYVYGADISVRKRTEAELIRRDRDLVQKNAELTRLNRLKSDLVAVTSHDLRSPLASIIMLAGSLKDRHALAGREPAPQELDRILDSAHRLVSFVNDLLDIDKLEAGRVELASRRVHVPAILRGCIESLAPSQARGQRFLLQVDGAVRPLRGDAGRLEQVFANLLANAAKFAPDGGEIDVRCRDAGAPGIEVTVSDRGPGIPEADLGAVFDRYYQVTRKGQVPKRAFGVGLGLAIVKAFCEAHGGSVRAERRDGGGTTFVVLLPVREAPPHERGAALILDPYARCAPGIADALRVRGFSAVAVETAYDARRLCHYEEPELVFVCGAASDLAALAASARAATGGRALCVSIVGSEDEATGSGAAFDHVLVAPVLDVEVLELVRVAELRRAPAGGAR